jgi:hypothetical protein
MRQRRRTGPRRNPAQQRRIEQIRIDRLGDVVVHAGGEAVLAVLAEGIGGHGDDRHGAAVAQRAHLRAACRPSTSGICTSISTRS